MRHCSIKRKEHRDHMVNSFALTHTPVTFCFHHINLSIYWHSIHTLSFLHLVFFSTVSSLARLLLFLLCLQQPCSHVFRLSLVQPFFFSFWKGFLPTPNNVHQKPCTPNIREPYLNTLDKLGKFVTGRQS